MSKQKKAKHTPDASSGKPQDKPKSDDALRVELILRNSCGLLQDPNAGPDLESLTGREWKWGKYTNPDTDTNQTVEGWAPVNMDSPVTTVDMTPGPPTDCTHEELLETLNQGREIDEQTRDRLQIDWLMKQKRLEWDDDRRREAVAEARALARMGDVNEDGAVTQANKLDYNTTLETFMENFCEPLRTELIKRCAKQLRDAHKNKTCLLPSYVGKPKKGQRHAHNAAVLMKDWPRLRDHIPELPPLKPPRSNTISTDK